MPNLIKNSRTSLLIGLFIASSAYTQTSQNFQQVEIKVLPVQGNVYMLVGAGGNVTAQIGEEGVLIVDTQYAELSHKLHAEIKKLSDRPIQFVINTHAHKDHTGGNANFAKFGQSIFGGNVTGIVDGAQMESQAKILAHENVLLRIAEENPPILFSGWPTDTFFRDKKELFFNGEGVQILHQPAAHTDGDSIVFFRRSDVISTGDVFSSNLYPVIDSALGGSIQGIIEALSHIIDLAVPALMQEGGTMIIPGHGRLCDEADVVEYRDMVIITKDRIEDMIKKGMTLEEVIAARPTLGYDGQYGAQNGLWTTERFVEAVYRDLGGT